MTKYVVQTGWDEAPHLDEAAKASLISSYLPHERDARTRGMPSLGAGAIYPVPESEIICEPGEIPPWYRRVFGMDVGWNRTACVWGALNPETDILYLYGEYYRGQAEPAVHAQAIKARGEWIPGIIDPASRGRQQSDGEQLLSIYSNLGLSLGLADNARESGIYAVWTRLSTGRLQVVRTMQHWLSEYRVYRRDDKGAVVKEADHLMDATRYLVMSGVARAIEMPVELAKHSPAFPQAMRAPKFEADFNPMAQAWNVGKNQPQEQNRKTYFMPHRQGM